MVLFLKLLLQSARLASFSSRQCPRVNGSGFCKNDWIASPIVSNRSDGRKQRTSMAIVLNKLHTITTPSMVADISMLHF